MNDHGLHRHWRTHKSTSNRSRNPCRILCMLSYNHLDDTKAPTAQSRCMLSNRSCTKKWGRGLEVLGGRIVFLLVRIHSNCKWISYQNKTKSTWTSVQLLGTGSTRSRRTATGCAFNFWSSTRGCIERYHTDHLKAHKPSTLRHSFATPHSGDDLFLPLCSSQQILREQREMMMSTISGIPFKSNAPKHDSLETRWAHRINWLTAQNVQFG